MFWCLSPSTLSSWHAAQNAPCIAGFAACLAAPTCTVIQFTYVRVSGVAVVSLTAVSKVTLIEVLVVFDKAVRKLH